MNQEKFRGYKRKYLHSGVLSRKRGVLGGEGKRVEGEGTKGMLLSQRDRCSHRALDCMLVFFGPAERPLCHDGEALDPGQTTPPPCSCKAHVSHHEMRNGVMIGKLSSLKYLEKGGGVEEM